MNNHNGPWDQWGLGTSGDGPLGGSIFGTAPEPKLEHHQIQEDQNQHEKLNVPGYHSFLPPYPSGDGKCIDHKINNGCGTNLTAGSFSGCILIGCTLNGAAADDKQLWSSENAHSKLQCTRKEMCDGVLSNKFSRECDSGLIPQVLGVRDTVCGNVSPRPINLLRHRHNRRLMDGCTFARCRGAGFRRSLGVFYRRKWLDAGYTPEQIINACHKEVITLLQNGRKQFFKDTFLSMPQICGASGNLNYNKHGSRTCCILSLQARYVVQQLHAAVGDFIPFYSQIKQQELLLFVPQQQKEEGYDELRQLQLELTSLYAEGIVPAWVEDNMLSTSVPCSTSDVRGSSSSLQVPMEKQEQQPDEDCSDKTRTLPIGQDDFRNALRSLFASPGELPDLSTLLQMLRDVAPAAHMVHTLKMFKRGSDFHVCEETSLKKKHAYIMDTFNWRAPAAINLRQDDFIGSLAAAVDGADGASLLNDFQFLPGCTATPYTIVKSKIGNSESEPFGLNWFTKLRHIGSATGKHSEIRRNSAGLHEFMKSPVLEIYQHLHRTDFNGYIREVYDDSQQYLGDWKDLNTCTGIRHKFFASVKGVLSESDCKDSRIANHLLPDHRRLCLLTLNIKNACGIRISRAVSKALCFASYRSHNRTQFTHSHVSKDTDMETSGIATADGSFLNIFGGSWGSCEDAMLAWLCKSEEVLWPIDDVGKALRCFASQWLSEMNVPSVIRVIMDPYQHKIYNGCKADVLKCTNKTGTHMDLSSEVQGLESVIPSGPDNKIHLKRSKSARECVGHHSLVDFAQEENEREIRGVDVRQIPILKLLIKNLKMQLRQARAREISFTCLMQAIKAYQLFWRMNAKKSHTDFASERNSYCSNMLMLENTPKEFTARRSDGSIHEQNTIDSASEHSNFGLDNSCVEGVIATSVSVLRGLQDGISINDLDFDVFRASGIEGEPSRVVGRNSSKPMCHEWCICDRFLWNLDNSDDDLRAHGERIAADLCLPPQFTHEYTNACQKAIEEGRERCIKAFWPRVAFIHEKLGFGKIPFFFDSSKFDRSVEVVGYKRNLQKVCTAYSSFSQKFRSNQYDYCLRKINASFDKDKDNNEYEYSTDDSSDYYSYNQYYDDRNREGDDVYGGVSDDDDKDSSSECSYPCWKKRLDIARIFRQFSAPYTTKTLYRPEWSPLNSFYFSCPRTIESFQFTRPSRPSLRLLCLSEVKSGMPKKSCGTESTCSLRRGENVPLAFKNCKSVASGNNYLKHLLPISECYRMDIQKNQSYMWRLEVGNKLAKHIWSSKPNCASIYTLKMHKERLAMRLAGTAGCLVMVQGRGDDGTPALNLAADAVARYKAKATFEHSGGVKNTEGNKWMHHPCT